MDKISNQKVLSCFEHTLDVLFSLETIIKVTHDICRDKELYSIYYNLPNNAQTNLSEERNQYINMLSLALDKVSNLKEMSFSIERELTQLK